MIYIWKTVCLSSCSFMWKNNPSLPPHPSVFWVAGGPSYQTIPIILRVNDLYMANRQSNKKHLHVKENPHPASITFCMFGSRGSQLPNHSHYIKSKWFIFGIQTVWQVASRCKRNSLPCIHNLLYIW